jgi:hypothetical protein
VRTVQRAVAPVRQAQRAADLATVRVETAPGAQLQIDFGEKRVEIAGSRSTVSVRQMACAPARRIVTICSSVSRVSSWAPGARGMRRGRRRTLVDRWASGVAGRRAFVAVPAAPRGSLEELDRFGRQVHGGLSSSLHPRARLSVRRLAALVSPPGGVLPRRRRKGAAENLFDLLKGHHYRFRRTHVQMSTKPIVPARHHALQPAAV